MAMSQQQQQQAGMSPSRRSQAERAEMEMMMAMSQQQAGLHSARAQAERDDRVMRALSQPPAGMSAAPGYPGSARTGLPGSPQNRPGSQRGTFSPSRTDPARLSNAAMLFRRLAAGHEHLP